MQIFSSLALDDDKYCISVSFLYVLIYKKQKLSASPVGH